MTSYIRRNRISHLNFNYEGKQVLHDVNLQIPAGSSLAIVDLTR